MALRDGVPFAGLNEIEDRIPDASESLWLAAIAVDDPAKSVATAKRLGATIHEDVRELKGWGTFALIQDPQGAPVMLVKPERQLGGTQGYTGWRWAELWTHDTAAGASFYRQVVGYGTEDVAIGDSTYAVFSSAGKRQAGLVEMPRPDIAPRWAPYVGVTDLRGMLVKVWEKGGKVLREPAEVTNLAAGQNRVALIADPTGAALFLYQLEEGATADPSFVADAARATANQVQGRAQSVGGASSNAHVSVTVGYGFGPGWGAAYPGVMYRPYGPPIY